MTHDALPDDQSRPTRKSRRWWQIAASLLLAYLLLAYVAVPFAWERYAKRHPSFDRNPRITQTSDGHPGDPLNVALIGSEDDLKRILEAAGWFPATPLGVESDLKIGLDTVLSRPDVEAPVSSLFLFGRKEDLAFEQPVGHGPRQRHHVRFWKTPDVDGDGRPLWIGSASFDERAGLSHTTGQVTHHIAPDVDAERNHLFADLEQQGQLAHKYTIENFHQLHEGRNGGGDVWRTDGALYVGTSRLP